MKEKNIEVEARSFITGSQYEDILAILKTNAKFIKEMNEETIYFSGDRDLRLRKNEEEAFIILKEGKIHDDYRKEYEIKFRVSDFENMKNLLKSLGYDIEIVWLRKRIEFSRGDLKILLDNTTGYGKIIEIEKMVQIGEEQNIHKELKDVLIKDFNINITSKKEFNKAFEYYKNNWRKLIKY